MTNNSGIQNDDQKDRFQTLKGSLNLIKISLPNVISFGSLWVLNFSNLTITESFKSENFVSAYAVSFMWANAIGFALILCLNNGLCAMASQAIGFNKENLVSSYYQRSQAINFTILTIMSVLLLCTGKIFGNFTSEKVADYSQEFMMGYIPSLFFYVVFDSTRNVFNAYKKFEIPNLILMVTYSIHVFWVYVLMRILNLGMFGLGLSRSVTELLNAVIILVIVKYKNLFSNLKFSWDSQAFKGWLTYLKYSVPMGSILYLDWISADIQTVFVASLQDKSVLAGHSAFVSIFLLFVVLPLGLSLTILAFLGNAIGQGNVADCKKIAKQGFWGAVMLSSLVTVGAFILEDFAVYMFTNTEGEIVNFLICYRIFNYLTIHFVAQTMCMGAVMRACGKQNSALVIPFLFYLVIGIPLQYFLVFTMDLGLAGSWLSFTFGCFGTAICFQYMVFNLNWNKQIATVQKNLEQQSNLVKQEIEQQQKVKQNINNESPQQNTVNSGNFVDVETQSYVPFE